MILNLSEKEERDLAPVRPEVGLGAWFYFCLPALVFGLPLALWKLVEIACWCLGWQIFRGE